MKDMLGTARSCVGAPGPPVGSLEGISDARFEETLDMLKNNIHLANELNLKAYKKLELIQGSMPGAPSIQEAKASASTTWLDKVLADLHRLRGITEDTLARLNNL